MVLRGQLKNWHRKERVIFEVLVFGLVIGNISTHLIWTNDDFYGVSVTSFLILQYNMTIFLVLMSLLVTMKYRQDFVRLQRKIGVKSMFVKYVSHEVRTPLNCCILGIAYLKGLITAPAECFISEASIILEELAEGCDMAVDFMNNLLLYEKVDTMELPLYLKREDLSQLCVQASKTFKMSAKHLEINLNVDIHSSLTSTSSLCGVKNTYCRADVNIDGPKVLIVLRNLMSNAMKFTPKGGNVTLSVLPVDLSCGKSKLTPDRTSAKINAAEPEDVTHFRLILSDTGRGLSAQEQAQLFTKIVQFSPNENQKGGGSGIGLYLSHKIMANHKLKVQVCSAGEVGKGTEFFIDFPKFETAVAPDLNISDSRPISSSWTSIILCRSRNSPLLPLFDTICMRRRVATTIVASTATDVSAGPSNVSDASDRSGSEDGSRFAGGSLPRLVTHSMRKSQSSVRSMDDSQSLHDLSILIVDDSFLNRKMISRTLHQKRVGSKFQCLDDGDELLADFGLLEETLHNRCADDCDVVPMTQLKDEKKYDIILLDDNMTRMNGSEAVKVLRSRGYNGLIVGLTGCALEEDLTSFCEAGVDYALPKPFVVEDFIRIVKSHF
jgi:signal transduction histidine kinase/CheY-like chemotaxis protein